MASTTGCRPRPRRGSGAGSMYKLLGLIGLIMAVLVALSFWGLANG